jgi:hypothetical protein
MKIYQAVQKLSVGDTQTAKQQLGYPWSSWPVHLSRFKLLLAGTYSTFQFLNSFNCSAINWNVASIMNITSGTNCNVIGGSIHDGSLLLTNIPWLEPSSIIRTLSTLKQYLSEQPFYSNFTIPRVSQETPLKAVSQEGFSIQLKTTLSSSLSHCPLTPDHKTALPSNLYSLLVQIQLL